MSGYILQTGEKGSERLTILNQLTNPGFIAFLQQAGLKEGMKVLDVGCGTGILGCEIAKNVGHLLGIDISPEQIALAQKNRVPNVEFRQLSAHNISDLKEKFDLIYFRYILQHVKDPPQILKNAVALLEKGGIIVCDELFDSEAYYCEPPNEGYTLWSKGGRAQYKIQGSDGSIGMKLRQILLDIGLEPFLAYSYTPILQTPKQKKLLRLGFEEAGAKVVEAGFFTNEEVELAKKLLQEFENDNRYLAFYSKYIRIAAMRLSAI
ncbi:MAG: class I SAM-dependent methyltransferase [Verrucomicrobia bacterium]|nr:class I SAM-dependent methyltransferase [Verrucomicrobiota bacterium]